MNTEVESVAQFITVLVAFVFVLAITVWGTRFLGNVQKIRSSTENFDSIEAFKLGSNSYLQLVRIGKRYFVLAVSKESVTVVTELDEEELKLPKESGSKAGSESFMKVLDKAKDSFKNRGGGK